MVERQHFFEFNWWFFAGLLFAVIGAWLTEGPVFVLIAAAITGAALGVYYLIWRWWRNRKR